MLSLATLVLSTFSSDESGGFTALLFAVSFSYESTYE